MYKIEVSATAAKILESLSYADRNIYARIIAAIESLAQDPFQAKQLKGPFKGSWSHRVGNYRVVYYIYREKLTVFIIDVGHRKEIYKHR